MKRLICLILFLLSLNSFAQILNPVKWDIRAEKVSATEYDLIFSANIDHEWAIYSQFVGDDGPLPTWLILFNYVAMYIYFKPYKIFIYKTITSSTFFRRWECRKDQIHQARLTI